jgi:hypothetical protein
VWWNAPETLHNVTCWTSCWHCLAKGQRFCCQYYPAYHPSLNHSFSIIQKLMSLALMWQKTVLLLKHEQCPQEMQRDKQYTESAADGLWESKLHQVQSDWHCMYPQSNLISVQTQNSSSRVLTQIANDIGRTFQFWNTLFHSF